MISDDFPGRPNFAEDVPTTLMNTTDSNALKRNTKILVCSNKVRTQSKHKEPFWGKFN